MKKQIIFFLISAVATIAIAGFLNFNQSENIINRQTFLDWKINEENAERPTYGSPDEAMKWYIEQREYPLGKIPVNWREEAFKHISLNKMQKSLDKPEEALSWTSVGPSNIGGRIRSIAVHPSNPDIVYIGSVSGGIWKTLDGGGSWSPLKDDMENLAVCSIVINPNEPNTIYAGTGEGFFNGDALRGEGIFKSTDAGATWVRLSSTNNSNFYYVNKLVYDSATNILWAATRKGLYGSTDGGATFSEGLTGNGADIHCTDVEIAATSPTTIYACFGLFNDAGVYRSVDGGYTFNINPILSQSGQGRIELATSASNPAIVYASFLDLNTNGVSLMAKTTNGGDEWNQITVPGPAYSGADNYASTQAWYNNILAVDPDNANNVLVGGLDLWKSTNGGTSWIQKTNWYQQSGAPQHVHADHHALFFAPSNSNIIYNGNDGGIYKSTNKGDNWSKKNNDLFITQFYYGAVAPTGTKYYGGAQDNGTIAANGTNSWFEIIGGDGGATEVDFSNPNIIYGEYVNLAFYKSTNGGNSFTKKMNGIPKGPEQFDGTTDRTLFISPFSIDPNNSNTLVAGTYRVWRTTDGAENWNSISVDLTGDGAGSQGASISTVIIAKGNSDVIYAGCSNGQVQVTTNGGTSWTNRSSGLPNAYCTRIASSPDNPAIAYATFSGYLSNKKIYKTTNSGQTWSNISSNLPNIPVSCVVVNPENTNNIFIGTDLGIFSSDDGGTSWSQDNGGLANVSVMDLDYRSSDKRLYAATHGRGMFYASLSGGGTGTQVTLLEEKFDNQAFPPNGWSSIVKNQNNTWKLGNITDQNFNTIDPTNINSAICPWVAEDQDEWLITPFFSLGNGNASIEFYAAHSTQYLTSATLYFRVSTNGGSSWQTLWEAQDDGQDFKWRLINVDLSAYKNMQNLKAAWEYLGNDGDLVGIDNVKITGYQSTTDIKDNSNMPQYFDLTQNFPNPFNPTTKIKYSIPILGSAMLSVQLKVYDILGKEIATLVNEEKAPGQYVVDFNTGGGLASGTYIYTLKAGNFIQSKKMVLLK